MNTKESSNHRTSKLPERLLKVADCADSLLDCVYQLASSLKHPKDIPRFVSTIALIASLIEPNSLYAQTDQKIPTDLKNQPTTELIPGSGIFFGENVDTGEQTVEYFQDGQVTAADNDLLPASALELNRIEGNKKRIALLCTYPSRPVFTESVSYFEDLNLQLDQYWKEVSRGAINQEGSAVAGPYILDEDASYYELID